jgi:hypothetical protein
MLSRPMEDFVHPDDLSAPIAVAWRSATGESMFTIGVPLRGRLCSDRDVALPPRQARFATP